MQFGLLQGASKPLLIYLLLHAQFNLSPYKNGQNWSIFVGLTPINPFYGKLLSLDLTSCSADFFLTENILKCMYPIHVSTMTLEWGSLRWIFKVEVGN